MRSCFHSIISAVALTIASLSNLNLAWPATNVEIVPQSEPHGLISSVSLSANGNFFASAGADGTIRLWETSTFRIVRYFNGHTGAIGAVDFSPDGKYLISAADYEDYPIRVWDIETGRQAFGRFDGDGQSMGGAWVAYLPDGDRYISALGSQAKIKSLSKQGTLKSFATYDSDNEKFSLSENGRFLTSSGDGADLKLWDTKSGKLLGRLATPKQYSGAVSVSPDGTSVIGGSPDGALLTWSTTRSGPPVVIEKYSAPISAAAYSPNNRFFAVGTASGTLHIYDSKTYATILSRNFFGNTISNISISRDGSTLVATYYKRQEGIFFDPEAPCTIVSIDINSGKIKDHLASDTTSVSALIVSRKTGDIISTHNSGDVVTWSPATGREKSLIAKLGSPISNISISDSESRMVISSKTKLRVIMKGKTDRDIPITRKRYASISPDGNTIFNAPSSDLFDISNDPEDNTLLLDALSGKQLGSLPGSGKVIFSPNRNILAFCPDNSFIIYDIKGKIKNEEPGVSCNSAAFSPNGKILIVGYSTPSGGPTTVFDVSGAPKQIDTSNTDTGSTDSVAYSPTADTFATGGSDRVIKIFSTDTLSSGSVYWSPMFQLSGHYGPVTALAYSQNGKYIYSGSTDGTIKIWSVSSGQLLATIIRGNNGKSITLTPEGFFDASSSDAEALTVVRGLETYSIGQFYQKLYRPDLVQQKLAGDPEGVVAAAAESLALDKLLLSGPPPKVLVRPQADPREGSLVLSASLEDLGGGYGRVEWRVNGTTVGVSQTSSATTKIDLTKTLYLSQGHNVVEVVAYNKANTISSQPASLMFEVSDANTSGGSLYILSVGISDYYDSRLSLRFASVDANSIVDRLRSGAKGLFSDVHVNTLLDKDATFKNLRTEFQTLSDIIKPQDTFILFIAGHGTAQQGRYYFLPYDFAFSSEDSFDISGITQDQLQEWIANIPAQRTLVLLDTCDSGAMAKSGLAIRGIEQAVAFERLTRATGRTTIAASSDSGPALEGYQGHGVFTYTLLQSLAEADTNADGSVDVLELISWVGKEVPTLSERAFHFRQIPQALFNGENFAVGLKQDHLDPPASAPAEEGQPEEFVTITKTPLYDSAAGGLSNSTMAPGVRVTVLRREGTRAYVSRSPSVSGYVNLESIAPLQ